MYDFDDYSSSGGATSTDLEFLEVLGPFFMVVVGVIALIFTLIIVVSLWKIYGKAGRPSWASIVPIYVFIVFLDIVGKPWWWLLLLCIPMLNIVIGLIILHRLSTAFGKGMGFTLGLALFSIAFFPILAFGDAQYNRALLH